MDSENCDPVAVLGSVDDSEKQKKLIKQFGSKNASARKISETTHTDAVMSISLNPF